MATATRSPTTVEFGERRFVIHDVGWEGYSALLDIVGDGHPRIAYLRGSVEFMSPLIPHDRYKSRFGFIIEALTEELDIPRAALGSTTFRRQGADCGLEPDECYYLANHDKIGFKGRPDLDLIPPPDLAIEIDITNSLLKKLDIHAGLRIPEVWRFDGEELTVLLLGPNGRYTRSETSGAFPFLPLAELVRFLLDESEPNETRWGRGFRTWVRETLLPLYRNPADPE